MRIELVGGVPEKLATELLVVGAFSDNILPPVTKALDTITKGRISALVVSGELGKAAGSTLLLLDLPGIACPRVLLVSLGQSAAFSDSAYRMAVVAAGRAMSGGIARTAVVALAEAQLPKRTEAWKLCEAARVLCDAAYRFVLPGADAVPDGGSVSGVEDCGLLVADVKSADLRDAARRGAAVSEGTTLARDLGNMPANICNPAYFAATAEAMGREFSFKVEVLEREDMEKLGMGSFLSVGRASANACKLIIMHYKGGKPGQKPVVLVGKGITFDTGGISLKPGANLDEMKFDMGGAGSVFGAIKTVARLGLPLNVVGVIAAAENMPGGNASRPGDVVRSMSGKTIEILNTDAEGRLLLCDALTYVERFNPACVVDVATLTGACVIALGAHASGLFANDDALAGELLASGADTGDRAWQLPLWDDYMSQLQTNFADISNLGGPAAGAITAACFLAEFAKSYPWAHLDIAGTGSVSGAAKGSTGRPVPLLADFLFKRAAAAH